MPAHLSCLPCSLKAAFPVEPNWPDTLTFGTASPGAQVDGIATMPQVGLSTVINGVVTQTCRVAPLQGALASLFGTGFLPPETDT
jgi:hypothetical protein